MMMMAQKPKSDPQPPKPPAPPPQPQPQPHAQQPPRQQPAPMHHEHPHPKPPSEMQAILASQARAIIAYAAVVSSQADIIKRLMTGSSGNGHDEEENGDTNG